MIESSREGAAVQNVNGVLKVAENLYINDALDQSNQETYNLDLTTATNLEYKGSGTTADKKLPYNTTIGYLASTSGNISGVYDMSGGAHGYVMGVKADSSGK